MTQAQIKRFREIEHAAKYAKETILSDFIKADGTLEVVLQTAIGKVRNFISIDGKVRCSIG
jgi:hypothetical protein